jgi:hypothetical protein
VSDEGFVVTPVDVAALAGVVLEGSGELAGAAARAQADAGAPTAAFGNLPAGGTAAVAALDALDQAGGATNALVTTLETDADALVQVAFAYAEAEEAARRDFDRRTGPR